MKTIPICFVAGLCLAAILNDQAQTPPAIATKYPTNLSLSLGATATFQVFASGSAPMDYQWYANGVPIPGATLKLLSITNVQLTHAGDYWAMVTNLYGSTTSRVAKLEIDPTFTKITTGPIVTDRVTSWCGAWGDFDGDGRLDLGVFGDWWNTGTNTQFYHNEGNGEFSRVMAAPIFGRTDRASYSAWVDYDNDGDLDVFVTTNEGQDPFVYVNQGRGVFVRDTVNRSWSANQVPARGSVIAWGDYDNDGFVDAALMGGGSALLHNNGNGTFNVITNALATSGDNTESCAWIDYDNDGDLDLFAARSSGSVRSQIYRNDGGGKFVEATPEPMRSEVRFALGGAWADFDNDGDLDVLIRGFEEPTRFYLNNGDGTFTSWAGQPASLTLNDAGNAAWGDYDNDGYLDLFISQYTVRNRLFRNLGDGNFEEIHTGSLVNDAPGIISFAPAWVDYDGDGALDLFVARLNLGPNYLYRNNGNTNTWIEVRLTGATSNRLGIGARILVTANVNGKKLRQMRQITAQAINQELIAHFGLGDATIAETIRIEWPSGIVQELTNVSPRQILTVTEPSRLIITGPGQFQIQCWKGMACTVEASADLVNWTPIGTVTNDTGTLTFPVVPSGSQQFYRTKTP